MVKKTYELRPEDAATLISMACRYRAISTRINETNDTMYVYTTIADNDQPTSQAAHFALMMISDEPPQMPKEEHEKRVLGKFPSP